MRRISNLTQRTWHHFVKNHAKTDDGVECEYNGRVYTAETNGKLLAKLKRAISKYMHENDTRNMYAES